MSLYLHVAGIMNIDEVMKFESELLEKQIPDETERMLKSWNSRWRKESLEHYLNLGWSFLARDRSQESSFSTDGKLVGLFLAQPLLFLDGQTQSLWIEHMSFLSLEIRDQLCELAYKLGREKHLQKVYFPNHQSIHNILKAWRASDWKPEALEVKTTNS